MVKKGHKCVLTYNCKMLVQHHTLGGMLKVYLVNRPVRNKYV